MTELNWNPNIPDQEVRMKNNPGKQGITTGKTKESAGRLLVEVKFGTNEKSYKIYQQLELCNEEESIRDLLKCGRFGTSDDLRRILTFEKIKGELTNIFYSMESSNTDFYPYQFKPVLKFFDSPTGRLLIADEVGLGKTIESMYIWKELEARENAKRLLIVCPAMLRDKWINDLNNRFNIKATLISGKKLLEECELVVKKPNLHSFVYVASLEGLRIKNWEEQNSQNTKAQLAKLLEENPADNDFGIFDFVIIDEAHYLRNPDTANHKFANLLRDATRYLILLTATPIQIRSNNLYQLLKIISPDDFVDSTTFEKMLEANKPIIDALKLIWQTPPNLEETKEKLNKALKNYYFSNNYRLKQVYQEIESLNDLNPEIQSRISNVLESTSLLGQFMTRSRKKEVLEDRIKRRSQTLNVNFTLKEKQVYDYITYKIRLQSLGESKFNVFRLMARQREMSSCMVAALECWQSKKINNKDKSPSNDTILDNLLAIEEDDEEEEMYEIYGFSSDVENNSKNYTKKNFQQNCWSKPKNPFPDHENENNLKEFIDKLKKSDTKYNQLSKFLLNEIKENPREKFVLFAFYRNTLSYLQKRLKKDGITTVLIQGGMDRQEKEDILRTFQEQSNISVLLSSEVGSEGIDLQFCRFIINYDLPWNPMKVEQRIGRLDRLNQKHKTISIINFSLKDTIEEYILEKLYERIKIFEESIGDLEEILGEKTEELFFELLRPDLTESELKQQAENTILAIASEVEQQRKLENEAINLFAFTDYILGQINDSKTQGRWLQPRELTAFVADFFKLEYPGTIITPHKTINELFELNLSAEAKVNLKLFCTKTRFATPTSLYSKATYCFFNSKISGNMGKNYELISPTHPLIQWIRDKYHQKNANNPFIPVSASQLFARKAGIKKGVYLYLVQQWKLEGIRTEKRLAYKLINLDTKEFIANDLTESALNHNTIYGTTKSNVANLIELEKLLEVYDFCEEELQLIFFDATEEFKAENEDRCRTQVKIATSFTTRKNAALEERIIRFKNEGKLTIISAEQGKINKNNQELEVKLKRIEEKRKITESNETIATGLIFVED